MSSCFIVRAAGEEAAVLLPAGYTVRASAHSADQAQAQQGSLMYYTVDSSFITI